jgi:hypothetical protein
MKVQWALHGGELESETTCFDVVDCEPEKRVSLRRILQVGMYRDSLHIGY